MGDVALRIICLPIRIMVEIAKHPRYLILVAIGIFAIMGIKACNTYVGAQSKTVNSPPAYQAIAPAAPYIVQTASRVYYVSEYTDDGQAVTLQEYYTYNQKKWQKAASPLVLDRKYYGEIIIHER